MQLGGKHGKSSVHRLLYLEQNVTQMQRGKGTAYISVLSVSNTFNGFVIAALMQANHNK